MAGNDATSSELFPGWSSVVHQPADEPEESDLPSTVDITAFTTGLSAVELGTAKHDDGNSDSESDTEADSSNSGTDASQSCSQSDSSDTDSSTSSQESSSRSGRSSPSPEFSVTSSQTDGLRLTIATVRKQSPSGEKNMNKPSESAKIASKSPSSSSDSAPSSDSESEKEKSKPGPKNDKKADTVKSETTSSKTESSPNKSNVKNSKEIRRTMMKTRAKALEKKEEKSVKSLKKEVQSQGSTKSVNGKVRQRRRTRKMASLPLSRGSTYSSSDSDDSDTDGMLASCSLQEIREEDLAAILPDQQEIDAFDFECNRNDKNSPATGDMSGSDMELPQQAVNALIQRTTESSSEGEIHAPPNPSSLYANSLLQQFVAQTQMLNAPCSLPGVSDPLKSLLPATNLDPHNTKVEVETVKRKRGRPKKIDKDSKTVEKAPEYCTNPNVSPDSGIQNSPDHVSSPEPTLSPSIKQKVVPTKQEPKKVEKPPPKPVKTEKPPSKTGNGVKAVPAPVKPKEASKNAITANRFDRVLYANADRVLYPPRRKVGRPPVTRKGPGRPPKSKPVVVNETQGVKNLDKDPKASKGRHRNRPVLSVKNKLDIRSKYQTLKVPKLMHDKHKHKKHKKYKFKVLKPITASDPKINIEIDKLIADFIKCCAIAIKQPKENVPEQNVKTLKKVTKKRKTTEYSEKKKKKQSVSVTDNKVNKSNEQRLPLKKRHYHLASNSDSKTEVEEIKKEPEEEVKQEKPKVKQTVATVKVEKPKVGSTTPKSETQKSPVTSRYVPVIKSNVTSPKVQNNNNEYEVKDGAKSVGSHIDEAIEACINRFSDKKVVPTPDISKTPEEKLNSSKTSITATTPKKRHRLEMALSAEKVQPDVKSEPCPIPEEKEPEKVLPKITIESFISELKVKRNLMPKTPVEEEQKPAEKVEDIKETTENEQKVQVSPESAKKKVRKRRAINRTGFPTVKKKKKKPTAPETPTTTTTVLIDSGPASVCDRVPKEGEEYAKFVQRTENSEASSSVLPTPLTPEKPKTEDVSSKWELMSECESLPQDERTEFEDDVKPDRMTLRHRDLSPTAAGRSKIEDGDIDLDVSLESSIERLRSRLEERKKRKKSAEKLTERTSGYPKRKLRDVSPASSVEPLTERRLREERASVSGDERRGRKAPKWRKKKYLVAGLFSDYYKEDDEAIRQKRAENAQKPSRIVYNPAEHPYGLLPPPYHCGKYLRSRRTPFRLPYDIWWQHTHSQLPGRDAVPSWNYRKIRTNVYNAKTTTGACEPQSCNCKPSSNCGDDCINRLVLAECPASHRCHNQKIQRHEWAPGLEKFMTDVKGWGVRTKQPIKNGEFILEYVGEVVTDQEFKERMGTIYTQDTHHYCLHLDGGLLIDGHRMGGDGRFVNHSCAPNCEMQKWSVNGQFRMALFALRDIEAGEELTYDYNFSLFNPADGQECKCGSERCRGVIGGKSQRVRQLPEQLPNGGAGGGGRVPGRVGRPRKTEAKKKTSGGGKEAEKVTTAVAVAAPVQPAIQVKPMSHQQKCFILEHHCFLLRNLTKVRKVRDRSLSTASAVSRQQAATPTDTSAFMNHLNALQKPRNMKTRGLAQAEDDPELNKTVKLAALLKKIWTAVTSAKDEQGDSLSTHFMTMPSKRKVPEFYTRLTNPIDLSTIEQNIATGIYKTPENFDEDFNKLFRDYIRFYGRTSEMGISAAKLKKIYVDSKRDSLNKFEDTLGEKPPPNFVSTRKKNEEEDIIRCICGIPRDEGLMIQCERCLVWQHCECVKADASAPSYHCEKCVPRKVDYEIPMDEFTEHGHRYYMTLMRGDLQLRQGDTVYVLRDIPIPGTDKKHTYNTIGKIEYAELDIFRIERLWKEEKTGKRLAYGHHYLRPHETYHEPTRKFFPNEVMRVPLYEAVPVELVISHCWVMDLNTYCKGRPIGAPKEHIYICEYRVDKAAKMFTKVCKSKFPVCTKSFAFEKFETRLKLSRTYCPHDVDAALMKSVGRKQKNGDDVNANAAAGGSTAAREVVATVPVLPPVVRTPTEQKARLNRILLNLLSKMPTKQVLDVSYLLEGGRRRKKPVDNVNK